MKRILSHLSLSHTFTGNRAWFSLSFSHLEEPSYDVLLALARQSKHIANSIRSRHQNAVAHFPPMFASRESASQHCTTSFFDMFFLSFRLDVLYKYSWYPVRRLFLTSLAEK